jgi:hypothetical protein
MSHRANASSLYFALSLALLAGCVGEAEPYFPDAAQAPVISSVVNTSGEGGAYEPGLTGGNTVTILGERLKGEQLSVRFGDRAATVLTYDVDDSRVSVLTPPGPICGGRVDVTLSHAGGVSTLLEAYEYHLPDDDVFQEEVASLELIGFSSGAQRSAVAFWAGAHPRQAGSMIQPGALYYLPGEVGVPEVWPAGLSLPSWSAYDTAAVADEVSLVPFGASNVVPFTFVRDRLTGRLEPCTTGGTPTWIPGVVYRMSISGEIVSPPIATTVPSPPELIAPGDAPGGIRIEDGVAQVNLDADLHLSFSPVGNADADAAYLLVELVVIAPGSSLPDQPLEIARVDLQADDEAGRADFAPEDLAVIPVVDTRCALLAGALVSARLSGDGDAARLEQEYLEAGCSDPEQPLAAYPFQGYLRMSRHYLHRVVLPQGLAGCPTPGACDGTGAMMVDLVSAYEVPASFLHLPVPECGDRIDNDGDGLADTEDPGCSSYLDETERDDTGGLVCDDGRDNDGDGLIDFNVKSGVGDPGCIDLYDTSELESTQACDNGVDDDGDGRMDYRPEVSTGDPGCTSIYDGSEYDASLPCDNGLDDDQDGEIDYRATQGLGDPGCSELSDLSEKDQTGKWPCDDGIDNEGDGAADREDHGCRTNPTDSQSYSPYEGDEFNPLVQCDNSIDDDGDGFTDYRENPILYGDPQCKDANDNSEAKP